MLKADIIKKLEEVYPNIHTDSDIVISVKRTVYL